MTDEASGNNDGLTPGGETREGKAQQGPGANPEKRGNSRQRAQRPDSAAGHVLGEPAEDTAGEGLQELDDTIDAQRGVDPTDGDGDPQAEPTQDKPEELIDPTSPLYPAWALVRAEKTGEAAAAMGVSEEHFKIFQTVSIELLRKDAPEADVVAAIKSELERSAQSGNPMNQEQLGLFFETFHPELDGKVREELLAQLKPMTPKDIIQDHDITDQDKTPANAEEILGGLEGIESDLETQLKTPNLDEETRVKIEAAKVRSATLSGSVRGMFQEGEAGHLWAKRIGKGIYYTFLASFILILLEMHAIHKMAAKK